MENEPKENNNQVPDVPEPETQAAPAPIEEAPEVSEAEPNSQSLDEAEVPAVEPAPEKPKKSKAPLITLVSVFVILAITAVVITKFSLNSDNTKQDQEVATEKPGTEQEEKPEIEKNQLAIKGNDLDDFDLRFLKMEDEGNKNIVYSPLSIKYALTMLSEGAAGESKKQIDDILGSYHFKPYTNSENLSLANALFANTAKKDKIKETYSSNLRDRFNAELIFDDFTSPDNINSWISDKTFDLVKDIVRKEDLNPLTDYLALVNALAIDMDWVNEIQLSYKTAKEQGIDRPFNVYFEHEKNAHAGVSFYYEDNSPVINFSDGEVYYASDISAIANKYDIIKELGEDGVRTKVQEEYESWAEKNKDVCTEEQIKENAPDLDEYVNTLSQHYGYFGGSTDFEFYNDEDIKVFAKDLKTYDGTTLQYVGIMPKKESLSDFLKATSAKDLNSTMKDLKKIELDSFKDGVITKITGSIPHFDFDYDLNLKDDLETLGIEDVFSPTDADLSGITDDSGIGKQDPDKNVHIKKALHKANIAFSNSGIKAGAATVIIGGGIGAAGGCSQFYYDFEVPIEEIDLSFNKPYLFLIRDKDSGEIWFAGSVYQPSPATIEEPPMNY